MSSTPRRHHPLTASRLGTVLAAYGAQGYGYAAVVSALPTLKDKVGFDETLLSLVLLGVCLMAASGSVLADVVAVRWGSRWSLAVGFLIEAVALGVMVAADDLVPFVGAALVYGIGLGSVDAACNMQGALAEAKASRPVFGRLYAAYTAAAILGAVATAAVLWLRLPALSAIAAAAVFGVVVAGLSVRFGDPYITVRAGADQHKRRHREHLPVRGIVLTGSLVFAAFVVDSAVASWSTLYLRDGLASSPTVAPFGYAAYLAVVLLGRLAADPMVVRWGRKTTGVVGVGVALVGCLIVAAVPEPAAAVVGFALAGAAAGLLVPVAFSWAGELAPAHSDEVIARVNLFNYGGAVVGAVALGVLAGNAANLGYGFVLPGLALVAAIGVLRMITQGAGPQSAGVEAS